MEAIAVAADYNNSTAGSAAYTINLPTVATPAFSSGTGTYTSIQSVTIGDTTPGATIYYTTNGTAPATSSSTLHRRHQCFCNGDSGSNCSGQRL